MELYKNHLWAECSLTANTVTALSENTNTLPTVMLGSPILRKNLSVQSKPLSGCIEQD